MLLYIYQHNKIVIIVKLITGKIRIFVHTNVCLDSKYELKLTKQAYITLEYR